MEGSVPTGIGPFLLTEMAAIILHRPAHGYATNAGHGETSDLNPLMRG